MCMDSDCRVEACTRDLRPAFQQTIMTALQAKHTAGSNPALDMMAKKLALHLPDLPQRQLVAIRLPAIVITILVQRTVMFFQD